MDSKATFGVIVSTRGFFPAALAEEGRKQIVRKLEGMGFGCVILPEGATPHGAVETLEDARKCADLFREHRDRIDGLLVVLPNFGDEQGVAEAVVQAGLDVPVLVHASDDAPDKMGIEHRRDSFCGKLSVCCNFHQRGVRFTNTSLHSCAIESDALSRDVEFFGRVCCVVRGLKGARIGAIGQRPDPFHTVRYSEKLLQASGITVCVTDLSEIIGEAQRMAAGPRVAERIAEIKRYGAIPGGAAQEPLEKSAKLSLAIEGWAEANRCAATAVQCWSSIQENYGCATCLPMSMMGEKGKPSACETDVMGAVSMLALQLASGTPSGYLDWNNNYGDDREKCVCTHCSNFPKGFVGGEVELSPLDILGQSLGRERCFAGIKANVAPGPMTFCKASTDDVNGRIRAYVGEGEFADDPCQSPGGIAVCKVPGLQALLDHLCRNGFEHHVAMGRGHQARVLEEALGNYLGWDLHRHAP